MVLRIQSIFVAGCTIIYWTDDIHKAFTRRVFNNWYDSAGGSNCFYAQNEILGEHRSEICRSNLKKEKCVGGVVAVWMNCKMNHLNMECEQKKIHQCFMKEIYYLVAGFIKKNGWYIWAFT